MRLRCISYLAAGLSAGLVAAAPRPQTSDLDSFVSSTPSPTRAVTADETRTETTFASPTSSSGDACARLSELSQLISVANRIVPAEAAWDCLLAVSFDANTAEPWLQSLRPYIRWQSTLAYLQDPPEDYLMPAYDVYAAYDEILLNVQNNDYENQYEFEFAIYRMFQQGYDAHFNYIPNLIGNIFSFGRPFSLVDVSLDGQELPKPYVYGDILLSYTNTGFEPSAVVEIDGESAENYLESFSLNGELHDPDALWNNLFLKLAAVRLGSLGSGPGLFSGGGRGDLIYPNASTTLTFENGTSRTYQNVAQLLVPFSGVTSAQILYDRFVSPLLPANQTAGGTPPYRGPAPGFPNPVPGFQNAFTGGYYLDSEGADDTAVLSLASFLDLGTNTANISLSFLDRAKTDGKTKLIIDLSANGGGEVPFGYMLFMKLFPNIRPYLGTRFRATETFDIIGQTISDWSDGTSDISLSNNPGYEQLMIFFNGLTPFPYASDLDEEYEPFPDWTSKFGPYEFNGDNFTSVMQWNISQLAFNISIDSISNALEPLFEPENIILLTDGYCASTCSNFVEMMTTQAGVKTVTVGGRPNRDTVQVVGGTRGTNNYPWANIFVYANETYALTASQSLTEGANLIFNTELGEYLGALGSDPFIPFRRGQNGNINVRDGIRKDDDEQVPLQFKYQAADCRIFWTADMTVDISALWNEVADVSWGDGECVSGEIQDNKTRKVKRSTKERMERRSKQRGSISPEQLDALAEAARVWTNHNMDSSQGSVVLP